MKHFRKTIPSILILVLLILSCAGLKESPRGKYLNFREHSVYYELEGEGAKTLVFIHGWSGSLESWKYQRGSFPGYRILAVDLPGNGKSSKDENAGYSLELFADVVYEVMKKEKIDSAFLAGHSMGFAVCEVMAQKYPQACAALCSMDGAFFEVPADPAEKEGWVMYNREFAKTVGTEEGKSMFLNMLFQPDTPQVLKDEVFKISSKVPLPVGSAMITGVEQSLEYLKDTRQIKIPCLAVYSPAYQLPPDYENTLRKAYPQLEYHSIAGVSHFLMMEIPDKINRIISGFLLTNY